MQSLYGAQLRLCATTAAATCTAAGAATALKKKWMLSTSLLNDVKSTDSLGVPACLRQTFPVGGAWF